MVRKDVIREKILGLGADVCGFGGMERFTEAPINFRPIDLYPDCKSVIAVGIALLKGLLRVEPRLLYGHFNEDVVHKVDEIVFSAAKIIEKEYDGICVPIPSDCPYEYWETETMTGKGLLSWKTSRKHECYRRFKSSPTLPSGGKKNHSHSAPATPP